MLVSVKYVVLLMSHSKNSRLLLLPVVFLSVLTCVACSSAASKPAVDDKATPAAPSATATVQTPPPADGTVVTAARGDNSLGLARKYLTKSRLMTVSELDAEIRKANNLGTSKSSFKAGQPVTIPSLEKQPVVEKPVSYAKESEIRAIYLTGGTAGSEKGLQMIRHWREVGGNAVVFDIKDSDGSLSIPFDHPLAPKSLHHPITNLPKFTRYLHSQQMHAIARIALFRDDHIATTFSKLAVQSRSTGQPWRENGKLVWSDSSNTEVQDYNIALAKYVANSGADEIQFDYVRFPAEGDQKDARFAFESTHPGWQRSQVIADFLRRAHEELNNSGVLLSLDVFGIMAWQRNVDLAHTGQDIVQMAKYCDVISPMIYPSHFFGMDGYTAPGDAPEHFIGESMERFQKITADSNVVIRPWLQAFAWRTKTYSPEYILKQVGASKEKGGVGFLLWNARNDYAKPYVSMVTMEAQPAKYLYAAGTEKAAIDKTKADYLQLAKSKAAPVVKTTAGMPAKTHPRRVRAVAPVRGAMLKPAALR